MQLAGQRREEAYQSAKIALLQRVLGGWLGAAPVKTSALLHARFCMTSQAFVLHELQLCLHIRCIMPYSFVRALL